MTQTASNTTEIYPDLLGFFFKADTKKDIREGLSPQQHGFIMFNNPIVVNIFLKTSKLECQPEKNVVGPSILL